MKESKAALQSPGQRLGTVNQASSFPSSIPRASSADLLIMLWTPHAPAFVGGRRARSGNCREARAEEMRTAIAISESFKSGSKAILTHAKEVTFVGKGGVPA